MALGRCKVWECRARLTFALQKTETGTLLDYKYAVTGAGGEALAEAVDRVQLGQLQRLQRYVEGGNASEH